MAQDNPQVSQEGSGGGELNTTMGVLPARVLRPFTRYAPVASPYPSRFTVVVGTESRGQVLYRAGEVVAERVGSCCSEFPGGHLGTLGHPSRSPTGSRKRWFR